MNDVASLDDRRAARRDRRLADAAMHPAMRWVAGAAYWVAHRRDPDTEHAACGADGDLLLAPPGVPPCPSCYPLAVPRQAQ